MPLGERNVRPVDVAGLGSRVTFTVQNNADAGTTGHFVEVRIDGGDHNRPRILAEARNGQFVDATAFLLRTELDADGNTLYFLRIDTRTLVSGRSRFVIASPEGDTSHEAGIGVSPVHVLEYRYENVEASVDSSGNLVPGQFTEWYSDLICFYGEEPVVITYRRSLIIIPRDPGAFLRGARAGLQWGYTLTTQDSVEAQAVYRLFDFYAEAIPVVPDTRYNFFFYLRWDRPPSNAPSGLFLLSIAVSLFGLTAAVGSILTAISTAAAEAAAASAAAAAANVSHKAILQKLTQVIADVGFQNLTAAQLAQVNFILTGLEASLQFHLTAIFAANSALIGTAGVGAVSAGLTRSGAISLSAIDATRVSISNIRQRRGSIFQITNVLAIRSLPDLSFGGFPRNITCTRLANGMLRISFDAVPGEAGLSVDRYRYFYRDYPLDNDNALEYRRIDGTGGDKGLLTTETTFDIPVFEADELPLLLIRAEDDEGRYGPWASAAVFEVSATPVDKTGVSVIINFADTGRAGTYSARIRGPVNQDRTLTTTEPGNFEITGLANDSDYTIEVGFVPDEPAGLLYCSPPAFTMHTDLAGFPTNLRCTNPSNDGTQVNFALSPIAGAPRQRILITSSPTTGHIPQTQGVIYGSTGRLVGLSPGAINYVAIQGESSNGDARTGVLRTTIYGGRGAEVDVTRVSHFDADIFIHDHIGQIAWDIELTRNPGTSRAISEVFRYTEPGTHTITDLEEETPYEIIATAIYAAAPACPSTAVTFTTGSTDFAPTRAPQLTLALVGVSGIRATIAPLTRLQSDPPPSAYHLFLDSTEEGVSVEQTITELEHLFESLTEAAVFTGGIIATNRIGDSERGVSTPATITTGLSAPIAGTISPRQQRVDIDITPPLRATALEYRYGLSFSARNAASITTSTTLDSLTLEGLTPGRTHFIQVRAARGAIKSAWLDLSVNTIAIGELGPPRVRVAGDTATIEWDEPIENYAEDYTLQVFPVEDGVTNTGTNLVPESDRTFAASAEREYAIVLEPGEYATRVLHSITRRSPETRFGVAHEPAELEPPVLPPEVVVESIRETSADVQVSVTTGALRTRLQAATDPAFENIVFDRATAAATLYTISGLSPATTYYTRGRSETSHEVTSWAYSNPWKTLGLRAGIGTGAPPPLELFPRDVVRHPVSFMDLNLGDAYATGDDTTFHYSFGRDLEYEGRNYLATGDAIGFSPLPSSASISRVTCEIRMSNAGHELGRLLNARTYRGQPVNIYIADQDHRTGELLSVRRFTYYLHSHRITRSTITLLAEDLWSRVDDTRGRRVSEAEQRAAISAGLYDGVPRTAVNTDNAFNNADENYEDIQLGAVLAEDFRGAKRPRFAARPSQIPQDQLEFEGAPFDDSPGEEFLLPVPLGRTYLAGSLVAAWNPVNVLDEIDLQHPWVEAPEGAFEGTLWAAGVFAISEGELEDLNIVFTGERGNTLVPFDPREVWEFRRTGSGREGLWNIPLNKSLKAITALHEGELRTVAVVNRILGTDGGGRMEEIEAVSGSGEWTSTCVGYGTALVGVLFRAWVGWNRQVPKIAFYTNGVKVRLRQRNDPELVAQRNRFATDPDFAPANLIREFGPTENPALILRHLLMHHRYGARLDASQVDEQSFFDAAPQFARSFVTGDYATAVRGLVSGKESVRQTLQAIMRCSQALLLTGNDGKVRCVARGVLSPQQRAQMETYRFGEHNTTEFTIQERDASRAFNSALVETYVMNRKPGDKFSISVAVDQALEEDGGRVRRMVVKANLSSALVRPDSTPLPEVQENLEEIGRAEIMRSRLLRHGSFTIPDGLWTYPDLKEGDVVYYRQDRQGFFGDYELECRIASMTTDHNGTYRVKWDEYSDAIYDHNLPTTVRVNPSRLGPARETGIIRAGHTLDVLDVVPFYRFVFRDGGEVIRTDPTIPPRDAVPIPDGSNAYEWTRGARIPLGSVEFTENGFYSAHFEAGSQRGTGWYGTSVSFVFIPEGTDWAENTNPQALDNAFVTASGETRTSLDAEQNFFVRDTEDPFNLHGRSGIRYNVYGVFVFYAGTTPSGADYTTWRIRDGSPFTIVRKKQ